MLQEDNTREGFFKDENYDSLAAEAAKAGLWMTRVGRCLQHLWSATI
jgi:hypothetical protein